MPSRRLSALASAVFVTGNSGKLEEARRLSGIELQALDLDLPEIQSLDMHQVLRVKATEAHRSLSRPVIVDETALELKAMNGFPGCLVKWMLQSVGAEGIAGVALSLGEPVTIARCALLYFDGQRETLAEGATEGKLVLPARGEHGFGWDPVFEPLGSEHTFAELTGAEKDAVSHRGAAWRRLRQLLADR